MWLLIARQDATAAAAAAEHDRHTRATDLPQVSPLQVQVTHKTGVEMEALTGASVSRKPGAPGAGIRQAVTLCALCCALQVAALTVYDMLKAMSHEIEIRSTHLVEKTGGKSDTKFDPPPAI